MEPKPVYNVGAAPADKLDAFAIVELFGHMRIAGRLSETTVAGGAFVRIDVPACKDTPAFTRLYGPGAIYSITFVSEELARQAVEAIHPDPITIYMPNLQPALPGHRYARADESDDEDYDAGDRGGL